MSKSDGRPSRRTYLYRESPPAASGQRGNALFRFRIHNPARGKKLYQAVRSQPTPLNGSWSCAHSAYQNKPPRQSHSLQQRLPKSKNKS